MELQKNATTKMFTGATTLERMNQYQPNLPTWASDEMYAFDVRNATRNLPYFMYQGLFRRPTPEQQGAQLEAESEQWARDRQKRDQLHLSFLEKQEQLEVSIARIHTRGDEQAAIERTYETRLDYAQRIYDIEKRTLGETAAGEKLQQRAIDAQMQAAEELLQLQEKQLDALNKTTSGLFHTLLTKPSELPKQLGSTVHEAMIKPISDGLGRMVSSTIHPLIYGADGQGGIAGVFKGMFGGEKQDPLKATVDNTTATQQNSAHLAALTAILAGAMGVPAPAVAIDARCGLLRAGAWR